jgi:hypothetical protein
MDKQNNTGHLNNEQIAMYVDALIWDAQDKVPGDIAAHIEECDECAAQAFSLYGIIKNQYDTSRESHPLFSKPEKNRVVPLYIYKIAAVVIVFIGMFSGYWYFFRPYPAEFYTTDSLMEFRAKQFGYGNDVLSAPMGEKQENDIETTKNLAFKLSAPENGQIYRRWEKIHFKFKYQGAYPLWLKVLDNNRDTVYSQTLQTSDFESSEWFKPGLYYWELTNNGKTLYIGKFVVK